MADNVLKVRIKTRTDTEANWKSTNPVLLKGEVGITSDNKRYKVGDGSTTWTNLAYATLSWDDITNKPSTFTPSAHTHEISDVINLQTTLNGKAPATGSTSIKTLAETITLGTGDAATIDQANGTYRQRIKITDNSTSGDEVFGFYQSTDSGSNYTNLLSVRDDGVVVAKTFSGNFSGNATSANYTYEVEAYNSNEITLGGSVDGVPTNDAVWFNYREKKGGTTSSSATKILNYYFGNRFGKTDGVTVNAATFKGSLSGTATASLYPSGFASRVTGATWGNQDGTVLTDWHTSNGGDIAFRENGGQLNVVIDGYFYQNEGRYKCLDTNNYSSYALPLTGGSMTGDILFSNSGTTTRQLRFTVGDNDYGRVAAGATAANSGWIELASADDGNEPVYVRQYTGVFSSIKRTATLLDSSGNTSFPGVVTAPTFKGALAGNADTASSLYKYSSGNTGSSNSGYWYKLASTSVSTQYANNNLHFSIYDSNHGGDQSDFFEGIARLKQQAAMGSAPSYSVRCLGRYGLTTSNVKIVITANTASSTVAELWVQIPKSYTIHKIAIISNDGWTINSSMGLQQTLPSGSSVNAVDRNLVGYANVAYADESGNNIKASYGASLSVEGRNVSLLSKSGAVLKTIQTQDTNTWRPVQDNLTSTSTSDSLSANQGRVLATKVSNHESNKSNPHSVTKTQVGLGNVENIAQISAINAAGYYGMGRPDGNTEDWIRTTTNGLIPVQSGGAGSGHSQLGTPSWYFSKAYIDNIFDSTGSNIKAKYVNNLAVSNDLITYTMGDGTANKLVLGSVDKIINVALTSSGWTLNSSTGRYTQSVSNSEIKATYNAICMSRVDSSWSASTVKAYNKAFGIVCSGTATTADGSATFSTIKKPSTDITVALYCTTATDSLAADNNYAVSKTYVDNQLSVYERATYADLETAKSNAITATNNANSAVTNLNNTLAKLGNLAYVSYTVVKTI